MSANASVFEMMREHFASIAKPRFDRVAVRDMRPFASTPRLSTFPERLDSVAIIPPSLLGIRVEVDPDVEVGVIELRLGDETVDRFVLSELRA